MNRVLWVGVAMGIGMAAAPAQAQPPVPNPPAPLPNVSPQPAAPWANKFFVKDIASNREQPASPVITWDFGNVPHGTLCSHTFTITNIYDVPMQITEVRKSCTCLDFVPLTRVLQPNETGDFTVTMNSGKFVGSNAQTFYVTFGPKFVSTAVIRVSAYSQTEVTVNPGAVAFGTIAQGSRPSQAVKLEYKGRRTDWKIVEAIASPNLDVQVAEVGRGGFLRGGAEYSVRVGLKVALAAGPISEQVMLKTNDPNNSMIHVTVTGTVAAPLEVAPNRVRIDGIAIGQSAVQRVLIRAAKPFRVLAVDGAGDGVSVEVPPGGTPLPVQVITVKFDPTKPGTVARELKVKTDLDGGAEVVLPIEVEGLAK